MIQVTVCITWLPIATADTDAEVENCPTTNKSTAPYNACRKFEMRNGTAKRRSAGASFPSVSVF